MFSKSVVALALAGGAIANPLLERGVCKDSCAAAVTGSLALGDKGIRESHCASYLATTVTPPAYTTTVTITGTSSPNSHSAWKRTDVTYCPNTVPVYATSACGGTAAYSSACSCFGFTGESTTTVAPTTTTQTVYVLPTWASTCSYATSTVTVTTGGPAYGSGYGPSTVTTTVTTGGPAYPSGSGYGPSTSTVTVTPAALTVTANATCPTATPPASSCLTGTQATYVVNSFINFLENTDVGGTFDLALADVVLAPTFTDQSDSINFMIDVQNPGEVALGALTFASPQAFDYGQGQLQAPIPSVTTLNLEYGCDFIVWRWVAKFGSGNPVQGINLMYTNAAGQLLTDYSEFDNAAWLANYGNPQCDAAIAAAEAATAANCTSQTATTPSRKRAFNPANYRQHKRTPNNMLRNY